MLPFILINIFVSAAVVMLILNWWDDRQEVAEVPAGTPMLTATLPVQPNFMATPGPTLTVEPTEGPLVYVVQAGDMLANISLRFDVPMEDIVAANNLFDPNSLYVGQELIIPIGGLPTATPVPTDTPVSSEPPTPIPTEPAAEGEVNIQVNEVVAPGQLTDEAVSIINLGTRPVALQGWQLLDEQGHIYTFGQVTLFGEGAAILVHTETGQNGPSNLYWGLEEAIWQSGETISLLDSEGTVRAQSIIP